MNPQMTMIEQATVIRLVRVSKVWRRDQRTVWCSWLRLKFFLFFWCQVLSQEPP
jgi:hypothetical protein